MSERERASRCRMQAMVAACPHGFPSASSCVDCMYDDGLGARAPGMAKQHERYRDRLSFADQRDLDAWQEWLVQADGKQGTTAQSYKAYLTNLAATRRLAVDALTEDGLDEGRSVDTRSALRAWRRWRALTS